MERWVRGCAAQIGCFFGLSGFAMAPFLFENCVFYIGRVFAKCIISDEFVLWFIYSGGGGGFSHWHGIRICACLLGHFFKKFGIAIGGFSSDTKEPKLHKLGVFWANYCKKHPIWSKLGAFLSKMVYWWVENLAKNWYRDSQIFEVRQVHPRTILVKEPPRDLQVVKKYLCIPIYIVKSTD